MIRFLLSFLLASVTVTSNSMAQRATPRPRHSIPKPGTAKYIGLRYGPSSPSGVRILRSELVSGANDVNENRISEVEAGGVKMIWLERLVSRDSAGLTSWEVKDVLTVPSLRKNQALVFSYCSTGGQFDREIIAVADFQPSGRSYTRVSMAWRADRRAEKFKVISTGGVKCEYVLPMPPVLD